MILAARTAGLSATPFADRLADSTCAGGYTCAASARGAMAANGTGLTLFFGRLDRRAELATELGLPAAADQATLYARALERWSEDVDLRLVGHYCAITVLPGDRLRLARSPWTAPPLHFVSTRALVAAALTPAPLFEAGHPRRVDYDYLVDQLAFDHHDLETRGWYEGVSRVPIGTVVEIGTGEPVVKPYYDPVALAPVRFSDDDAYVERARELIDDGVRHAIDGLERPAIMLSGGLDSPIVAEAMLRALPVTTRLPSFTFTPLPAWDGEVPIHLMGDEAPLVRAFAQRHPRLDPHFPDPAAGGHDFRLRELLAATEVPTANIANIGAFHTLFEHAAAQGCDGMITALHGNFAFSLDGSWAPPEMLRQGRLRDLLRLLGGRKAKDTRSLPRMALAMAVLPNLPERVQRILRQIAHREQRSIVELVSLLAPEARQRWRERGGRSVFDEAPIERTREEAIRRMWASADSGEDLDLGFETLHGIAHRDAVAYRPLIEFCHAIPTDQYVRGGHDRWLARRLARGIMPDDQRLNTRMGRHNIDWHARLGARRLELSDRIRQVEGTRLGSLLDTPRMLALLSDWPDSTPWSPTAALPRALGLTRALTAAHFVSHAERRNDF